ncbi:hypothetical protein B0H11DRAFT_2090216 [Mycena galericulata]|nr:hypothetical protein B0H11DRAFT_2090216 [Mycena galericulata]
MGGFMVSGKILLAIVVFQDYASQLPMSRIRRSSVASSSYIDLETWHKGMWCADPQFRPIKCLQPSRSTFVQISNLVQLGRRDFPSARDGNSS